VFTGGQSTARRAGTLVVTPERLRPVGIGADTSKAEKACDVHQSPSGSSVRGRHEDDGHG
jgi:hypothetical protein